MISKIASITISIVVVGAIFAFIVTMWGAFSWPSTTGFTNYIVPAIKGMHYIPIIGTFLSIILWVISFEFTILLTKMVLWILNLFGLGQATDSPIR